MAARLDDRGRDIAQGLRHESGALTFPLNAEEYGRGYGDFLDGRPPPRMTSDSYDLGRRLALREAEERADLIAWLRAEDLARRERVRALLVNHPNELAEFDAKMAELDTAKPRRG